MSDKMSTELRPNTNISRPYIPGVTQTPEDINRANTERLERHERIMNAQRGPVIRPNPIQPGVTASSEPVPYTAPIHKSISNGEPNINLSTPKIDNSYSLMRRALSKITSWRR